MICGVALLTVLISPENNVACVGCLIMARFLLFLFFCVNVNLQLIFLNNFTKHFGKQPKCFVCMYVSVVVVLSLILCHGYSDTVPSHCPPEWHPSPPLPHTFSVAPYEKISWSITVDTQTCSSLSITWTENRVTETAKKTLSQYLNSPDLIP